VIDFGSTWCPPCRQLSKYLDTANAEFGPKGLRVIWADMGELRFGPVDKALGRHPKPYTVTLDNNELAGHLGVQGMPTVFILDRSGHVRETLVGYDDVLIRWRIDHAITSLLGESR
jgi:thiol-disulfide isomerase/thioredoxin